MAPEAVPVEAAGTAMVQAETVPEAATAPEVVLVTEAVRVEAAVARAAMDLMADTDRAEVARGPALAAIRVEDIQESRRAHKAPASVDMALAAQLVRRAAAAVLAALRSKARARPERFRRVAVALKAEEW